jgi:hypothetical protein
MSSDITQEKFFDGVSRPRGLDDAPSNPGVVSLLVAHKEKRRGYADYTVKSIVVC